MKGYIAKRFLQLIPILIGITFLSFSLMYLGLDKPFIEQYGTWLVGLMTGDMGVSYVSDKEVFATFTSKLPATIVLTIVSVLLTIVISVPLGILAAVKQNRFTDYLIRVLSFIGNSLPNFFVALLLILVFSVCLGWFPVVSSSIGKTGLASLSIQGTILPAFTLAIAMSSKYTRQIRATVLEELNKPYVIGARARGISERTILIKHVLKSCMIMIVTLLALSIGDLLGGTAIVETIFQWDGVGKLAVDSITMRDYPLIQAYVVWMAIIYVMVNLVADLVYHRLDPRVRLGGEK